jgi:hypothetical protein
VAGILKVREAKGLFGYTKEQRKNALKRRWKKSYLEIYLMRSSRIYRYFKKYQTRSVRQLNEQKRKFLIDELTNLNIYKTQTGKSIFEADNDELMYELVLSAFHEIDVEADANKWF